MSNICPCTMGNSISKALFGLRDVKRSNRDEPEQTASATVLSRSVQRINEITSFQESPWLYLVTFRLESAEELQVQTTEDAYGKMKEGTTGTLVWQGEKLISFP